MMISIETSSVQVCLACYQANIYIFKYLTQYNSSVSQQPSMLSITRYITFCRQFTRLNTTNIGVLHIDYISLPSASLVSCQSDSFSDNVPQLLPVLMLVVIGTFKLSDSTTFVSIQRCKSDENSDF